jgi:hypothetical protein
VARRSDSHAERDTTAKKRAKTRSEFTFGARFETFGARFDALRSREAGS